MRRKFGQQTRNQFDRYLRRILPQFVPIKVQPMPAGWRVFESKAPGGEAIYVVLGIAQMSDEFFVEMAWSRKGRFPNHLWPMAPIDNPRSDIVRDMPRDGEFLFRLTSLLGPDHRDMWKVSRRLGITDPITDLLSGDIDFGEKGTDDEPDDLVTMNVKDAVEKIVKYGLPYCEEGLKAE